MSAKASPGQSPLFEMPPVEEFKDMRHEVRDWKNLEIGEKLESRDIHNESVIYKNGRAYRDSDPKPVDPGAAAVSVIGRARGLRGSLDALSAANSSIGYAKREAGDFENPQVYRKLGPKTRDLVQEQLYKAENQRNGARDLAIQVMGYESLVGMNLIVNGAERSVTRSDVNQMTSRRWDEFKSLYAGTNNPGRTKFKKQLDRQLPKPIKDN
jgi:hypothetical protein